MTEKRTARATAAGRLAALALALLAHAAAPSQARELAYVPNAGDRPLQVFDIATSALVAEVELIGRSGAIAAAPDGREVYVVDDSGLAIIDTATNTVVGRIPLYPTPGAQGLGSASASSGGGLIGVSPDGEFACANLFTGLAVIDLRRREVVRTLPTAQVQFGTCAVSPDGSRILAAILPFPPEELAVQIYDTETWSLAGEIPLNPDDGLSGTNFIFSLTSTEVYFGQTWALAIMDWREPALLATMPLEGALEGGALTPDSSLLYITGDGAVYVIDVGSRTLVDSSVIPGVGSNRVSLLNVAVTADGARAYVINQSPAVMYAINTSTNAIDEVIPIGGHPQFLLIVDVPPPDPTPTPTSTPTPTATAAAGGGGGCRAGGGAETGTLLMMLAAVAAARAVRRRMLGR